MKNSICLLPSEMIQEITSSLSRTEKGYLRSTCKNMRNFIPSPAFSSELISWCIWMYRRSPYDREYTKKIYEGTPWGEVKIVWTGRRGYSSEPSWNIIEADPVYYMGLDHSKPRKVKYLKEANAFMVPGISRLFSRYNIYSQITIFLNGIKRFTFATNDKKNYWTESSIQTDFAIHCDDKTTTIKKYRSNTLCTVTKDSIEELLMT